MIQSFAPIHAVADYENKVFTVINSYNRHFSNKEEAVKALGHPCEFQGTDLKRFKKMPGWTIIRKDLKNA